MADLPIAAIVCIALGCYVAVIIGIILLCYFLKGRGHCRNCQCCALDCDAQSCECCIICAEACDCCRCPSLTSCLDSCCPNRKPVSCVDIILCQCCSSDGMTLCDCCTECEKTCSCLCMEIRLHSPREKKTNTVPSSKTQLTWQSDSSQTMQSIPSLPEPITHDGLRSNGQPNNLQLDSSWLRTAENPVPTSQPIGTHQPEPLMSFRSASTETFQGQNHLLIHSGVHSAGHGIGISQSDQLSSSRRSSRRRSPRRNLSPSQRRTRSPNRPRSVRVTTNIRPVPRTSSQWQQTGNSE